ncbi:MAG: glycosyltransferase family 4 protein [Deltaproteobacteria bacterium]|nr:glycosyltransferase family 4 protein [Deltaproteobacteria bacterium]
MKVVLLARKFDPFGGAERYISHLASSLVSMGHSVSIMAGEWPAGDLSGSLSLQGVEIIRIPFAQWDSISAVTSFAISSARAVKELRLSGKVDIVQSFERTIRQDVVRIGHGCHREWLHRRRRFLGPWRGVFLSLSPLHQLILFLERKQLASNGTKYVIANSERGKRELVEHYGIDPEKVVVIYNGVDRTHFCPLEEPEEKERVRKSLSLPLDRPLLLFVGSGFERKGLDFAIHALSSLRHLSPLLVVIGRGSCSSYFHLAHSLGVSKEVLFVEPSRDVVQWYQAADLFLLPSIYEPFSNACLEAMSSGIPVVISSDSGAAEVVREGVNGILLEEISDIPALGGAVERGLALDGKVLRSHNDQILTRFTWEENLSKTISIYERILSERKTDEKKF